MHKIVSKKKIMRHLGLQIWRKQKALEKEGAKPEKCSVWSENKKYKFFLLEKISRIKLPHTFPNPSQNPSSTTWPPSRRTRLNSRSSGSQLRSFAFVLCNLPIPVLPTHIPWLTPSHIEFVTEVSPCICQNGQSKQTDRKLVQYSNSISHSKDQIW